MSHWIVLATIALTAMEVVMVVIIVTRVVMVVFMRVTQKQKVL